MQELVMILRESRRPKTSKLREKPTKPRGSAAKLRTSRIESEAFLELNELNLCMILKVEFHSVIGKEL